MELTLAQIAAATGATYEGDSPMLARRVHGWSIDSRTLALDDLFFAIQGEIFDGHAFVSQVAERGAIACVVSENISGGSCPVLRVRDTVVALQQTASLARFRWGGQVVGVTGSAGKTSTKDIIAELLSVRFRCGKTVGNYNNHLGLPLSILRLPENSEIAVLEMGMNHAREIRELARIARPTVGVVTNVGYAHVEAFGSIDGIALAKRELIEELPPEGVAILNADDKRVSAFQAVHPGRSVTYGLTSAAEVRADRIESRGDVTSFSVGNVEFETRLAGRHSVSNILAGLAVAATFGIELKSLVQAVAGLQASAMRGQRTSRNGITILNDSYNSNPEAARNMVDVLKGESAKRRIAVLGEMKELGCMTVSLHREVGAYVAAAGIDVLLGISGAGLDMVEAATRGGLDPATAFFFETPEAAGDFLRKFVQPGDAILFKGSRGTHVEKALARMEA